VYQHHRRRNVRLLWGLIGLALIYGALVLRLHTLTGRPLLDGSIGVVLGLYICSRPAANAIDLFFERDALRQLTSGWSGLGWLALNLLVLFAGWLVIVIGATRFAGHPG
jgi:D-alanyl-lipoteichoic acid acyltransferase DltB (MBOAT superfamily)